MISFYNNYPISLANLLVFNIFYNMLFFSIELWDVGTSTYLSSSDPSLRIQKDTARAFEDFYHYYFHELPTCQKIFLTNNPFLFFYSHRKVVSVVEL